MSAKSQTTSVLRSFVARLLQTTFIVALVPVVYHTLSSWPALAGDATGRSAPIASRGQSAVVDDGANIEKSSSAEDPGRAGFSISVDGQRIAGEERPADRTRQTDVALSQADIQVKFDGLDVRPILNVATADLRHAYRPGDKVTFNVTTNYPNWISRAELRIFDAKDGVQGVPIVAVPAAGVGYSAEWSMPAEGPEKYLYVLRVYGKDNRFDETVPLALSRTTKDFPAHLTSPHGGAISAGRAEDRTAVRNIPIYGGAITVYGRNVPSGYRVETLGEAVPVDAKGSFVVQRILPPGEHDVTINVKGERDGRLEFSRNVNIPSNEWFYVGMADLTVGRNLGSSALTPAAPGEYERTYTKGRLAFYLKGKIKGQYLLTASADTGEEKVQNLFRNIDDKGPQELLRRIDPDLYYPVYGDASSAIEDAPTDGKFYVRLERGPSHVMWGRFKTSIKGTEFARNERKLYGAQAVYKSNQTTSHGTPVDEAEAYAAKPSTLPQRDSLLGTGGSVYFLSRQDINRGSETITIEVRDAVSDIVMSRRTLRFGEDYEINYVQGVVLLKTQLSSTARSQDVVSGGTLSGSLQYLVVQYEFTPALETVKGYSTGGRAQTWIADNVRVGVSGLNEQTGEKAHNVTSVDAHIRLKEKSFVELEAARSDGPGFRNSTSINGGLTIVSPGLLVGQANQEAFAYRARTHIDVSEFGFGTKGAVGGFFERRDAAFSSMGFETRHDQQAFGLFGDFEFRSWLRTKLKYKEFESAGGQSEKEGAGQIEYDWRPDWTVGVGVKHKEIQVPGIALHNGGRTDVGVKLTYKPDADRSYHVFGQATARLTGDISRNERVGVGTEFRVSEKVSLGGELSYGALGWGGLATISYDPTPDDRNYFGYTLDPDRPMTIGAPMIGTNGGRFVGGARHKYTERLSAYAENNYDLFGDKKALTSTYGVVYTPTPLWTVGGGVEYGDLKDRQGGTADISRIAPSISVTYKDADKVTWRLRGEARFENSTEAAKDRTTYLATAGLGVAVDQDWKFLAGLDAAISDSDQASILDGDYVKGSIGYAYRPVDNDRFNALFKSILIYDLPGPDQVTSFGSKLGPAQRSIVLSADGNYKYNHNLTLGGKYGFRIGEVAYSRSSKDFEQSSAHLGVLRADFHIVKDWDLMLEGRLLYTPEIDTTNLGVVTGVWRHLGANLKIGGGYNFGKFSDDLADLTHNDRGVFINMTGKF